VFCARNVEFSVKLGPLYGTPYTQSVKGDTNTETEKEMQIYSTQ